MSRVAKQPVPLPKGVEVHVAEHCLVVKGPKGQISVPFHPSV
ncbi:MAG: 50S ribosomal protein L6, partial [Acidithiobacillus ferrivorans]